LLFWGSEKAKVEEREGLKWGAVKGTGRSKEKSMGDVVRGGSLECYTRRYIHTHHTQANFFFSSPCKRWFYQLSSISPLKSHERRLSNYVLFRFVRVVFRLIARHGDNEVDKSRLSGTLESWERRVLEGQRVVASVNRKYA
jgi:hypothetical protein